MTNAEAYRALIRLMAHTRAEVAPEFFDSLVLAKVFLSLEDSDDDTDRAELRGIAERALSRIREGM